LFSAETETNNQFVGSVYVAVILKRQKVGGSIKAIQRLYKRCANNEIVSAFNLSIN